MLDEEEMTGGRDRKEFGNPLNDTEQKRYKNALIGCHLEPTHRRLKRGRMRF